MDKQNNKEALTLMGEFLATGLIDSSDNKHYHLTPKGKVEAEKAMSKLSHRERALALLLADNIIRTMGVSK